MANRNTPDFKNLLTALYLDAQYEFWFETRADLGYNPFSRIDCLMYEAIDRPDLFDGDLARALLRLCTDKQLLEAGRC